MHFILKEILRGFTQDRAILAGILAIWALFVASLSFNGIPARNLSPYTDNLLVYLSALLLFILPLGALGLYRERPESPIRHLRDRAITSASFWRGIPMLAALIIFLPAFSAAKSAIPLFSDYTWDANWIALDRAIFGTDAWRVLQPLFGYPLVTSALSVAYHLWIFIIYAGGVYFAMFARNRQLRQQYFIAFIGIWSVIGVFLAILFASVGPCFVSPILGDDTFVEQMRYLHAANERYPVMVLPVQETLLARYQQHDSGLGSGIAAMPAMHVAMAFTFFLAMRRVSKAWAVASGLFCVAVYIGSIHLAYHYAVDGIMAAAAALVIWKVAGLLARTQAPGLGGPVPAAAPRPLPAPSRSSHPG